MSQSMLIVGHQGAVDLVAQAIRKGEAQLERERYIRSRLGEVEPRAPRAPVFFEYSFRIASVLRKAQIHEVRLVVVEIDSNPDAGLRLLYDFGDTSFLGWRLAATAKPGQVHVSGVHAAGLIDVGNPEGAANMTRAFLALHPHKPVHRVTLPATSQQLSL